MVDLMRGEPRRAAAAEALEALTRLAREFDLTCSRSRVSRLGAVPAA